MKAKRFWAVLLSCSLIFSCSVFSSNAAKPMNNRNAVPFAVGSIYQRIAPQSLVQVKTKLSLDAGDEVRFDCDYVPTSASVDFGIVDSNNRFYKINCTDGSIDQAIEVLTRGQYTVVIRNNATYEVTVSGDIHY